MMNTARAVSSSNEEDQEAKKVVTFVTGNAKKLEEVKSILKLASTDEEDKGGKMMKINLISRSIDLPELQGDPIDIAKEKCLLASREIEGPTLVEDTSLCFNAFKGLPGPYVKWFLEKTGLDGLNNMLLAYEDKNGVRAVRVRVLRGRREERGGSGGVRRADEREDRKSER